MAEKVAKPHTNPRLVRLLKWSWSLLRGFLLIGLSYIILHPLFIKISASFMSFEDLFDPSVAWIPRGLHLENFFMTFMAMDYPKTFTNSFLLALSVSALQVAASTFVGYGLARYNFRGCGLVFGLVIFSLVIPPQLNYIPLYLNFRFFNLYGLIPDQGINLLNTFWPYFMMAVTATGIRCGLFIYIMRQFFKGMPTELEEAAYVDGAGPFKTFFRIALPGAIPALVVIFLFSFVWQWNDHLFAQMFAQEVQLMPNVLTRAYPRVARMFDISLYAPPGSAPGSPDDEFGRVIVNTGMLLFIAPLLFIYLLMQRYFIESIQRVGLVE